MHGDDADFIAYERSSNDGIWQTVSVWMIPKTAFRLETDKRHARQDCDGSTEPPMHTKQK